MTDIRRIAAEERIAHLERSLEDLSDVVAAQAREMARLSRTIDALVRRDAERAAEAPAPVQRPPHW